MSFDVKLWSDPSRRIPTFSGFLSIEAQQTSIYFTKRFLGDLGLKIKNLDNNHLLLDYYNSYYLSLSSINTKLKQANLKKNNTQEILNLEQELQLKTQAMIQELILNKINIEIIYDILAFQKEKPYVLFKEGLTKEDCLLLCKLHDTHLIDNIKHPLSLDQIKLNESNKEKQKKVQEDKKMLNKNQSNIEDDNIS